MDNKEQLMDSVIQLSSQKLYLLREILEATEAQRLAIEEDNIDKLNEIFDEKQKNIDEINRIDQNFNHCLNNIKKLMGISTMAEIQSASLPRASDLKSLVMDIVEVMGDIQAIEMENEQKLNQEMKIVKEQLQKINLGKKAISGYTKPNQADAFFIDRKK